MYDNPADPPAAQSRSEPPPAVEPTAQRQAELAWRSAASRAARAAQVIGMGTWEVDVDSGQASWDEQMWLLRKLPPRSAPLNAAERLALVHPDDRQRVSELFAKSRDSVAPVDLEFRILWPDGTVRWLASRSLEQTTDASGKRKRIGVTWDITDRHAVLAALQARELALHESQAKAQERNQFLARMSHELRTPLNAVLGFTQLLLAEQTGYGTLSDHQRQGVLQIHSAGQHLLSLVNDMLELSRLQSAETGPAQLGPAAAPQSHAAAAAAASAGAEPHTLLYIEDNPVNALLVKELLTRRSDFKLHIAVDGRSGVTQALLIKPELILIDMHLPDMGGLEVLRRLRAEPSLAGVPCIALSANAMPEDIAAALQAGMADYWTKPLDFKAFLTALDKLFGRAQTR